jgi:hypothetical protein
MPPDHDRARPPRRLARAPTRRLLFSARVRIDLAAADAELDAIDDLARRSPGPTAIWYTVVLRTLRATMSDRLEDATALVDRAEPVGFRIGAQPAHLWATIAQLPLPRPPTSRSFRSAG